MRSSSPPVYIFVDEFFPKDVRSTRTGLFNVLILGIGPFAANLICGHVAGTIYTDASTTDRTTPRSCTSIRWGAAAVGAILLGATLPPTQGKREGATSRNARRESAACGVVTSANPTTRAESPVSLAPQYHRHAWINLLRPGENPSGHVHQFRVTLRLQKLNRLRACIPLLQ